MSIQICGAPCCWGVDDPKNPYLPPWTRVLEEAGKAGYSAIELGPYGYLPIDAQLVADDLKKNGLAIVAGTIFHDLLDPIIRRACSTRSTTSAASSPIRSCRCSRPTTARSSRRRT